MALSRLIRCAKLFPSPQRSLTNPWLVSSPGTAALPPKLLRGIASIAPQLPSSSPSPQPRQEAAAAAPSSNRSRKPRKAKAADGSGGAAAVPTSPRPSPSISEAAGGAASTPKLRKAKAASSPPMIVSDGGGTTSQEEAASSRKPRKAKASSIVPSPPDGSSAASSTPGNHPPASGSTSPECSSKLPAFRRIGQPKTPRQVAMAIKCLEKRRLMWRQCPRSHASLPKGKGQYFYTSSPLTGELCGYIPTPDEVFPAVLDPGLREDEAKYLWERFTKDPDSIAKPGDKFPMSPMYCEHNVVEAVHVQVIRSALMDYYYGDGKGGRRGKRPWSDYANMFLFEG